MQSVKTCPVCKLMKQSEDFYKSKGKLSNYCKPCSNQRGKKYREANRDRIRKLNLSRYHELSDQPEYNRERYLRQRETELKRRQQVRGSVSGRSYELWDSAKRRAKNKGLEFSLSRKDIEDMFSRQGNKCSLTGIDFDFIVPDESWKNNPYSPSIDRVDSSKGYLLNNVRLVLTCVNLAINEWGQDVLDKWVEGYIKLRGSGLGVIGNNV